MSTQLALREAALNLCERAVHDGVNRRFWPWTSDLARSLTPSKLPPTHSLGRRPRSSPALHPSTRFVQSRHLSAWRLDSTALPPPLTVTHFLAAHGSWRRSYVVQESCRVSPCIGMDFVRC